MSEQEKTVELSPELKFAQHQVLDRIAKIEANLLLADPMLPLHCEEIRKALLENEELVHILPDDRITVFMAGMQKYKKIQLVEESKGKRAKSKITIDDL